MSLTDIEPQLLGEVFNEKYAIIDNTQPEPRVISCYFWSRSSLTPKELITVESYLSEHPSVRKSYEAMIERSKRRQEYAIQHTTT